MNYQEYSKTKIGQERPISENQFTAIKNANLIMDGKLLIAVSKDERIKAMKERASLVCEIFGLSKTTQELAYYNTCSDFRGLPVEAINPMYIAEILRQIS